MHKVIHSRIKLLTIIIVGVVGIILVVCAGLGLWDYLRTTQTGEDIPSSETVSYSSGTPSEKRPEVSNEYKVPNDQPRVIQIPSIGVDAYIQRVGIDQSGALAAPSNIFFTGWYVEGSIPGEAGLSIIDGHAGGRYADGAFNKLADLKTQDIINVQMGDMSWRKFVVAGVETYSLQDAARALFEVDDAIREELRLVTCDGQFDDKTQTYDKRTIVSAKFVHSGSDT